jgi:pimeloyl-ACP methyl ester carboxylesterase
LPFLPELYLSAKPALIARSLQRTGLPADYAEHYARRLAEPGAARAALGWYRAIPFALGESFERTAVPTTYIWGRDDPFLGRAAAEATAGYVSGDYRFIESDGGHWLPETRPAETINAILDRAMGRK